MNELEKDYFSDLEIRAQAVPQIPWGTIIVIMQNLKHMKELGTSLVPKFHGEA